MRRRTYLQLLSNVVHTILQREITKSNKKQNLNWQDRHGRRIGRRRRQVKAGAKAFGKKVAEPDRDLESEYDKEKIKEKLD
jgi:hypothetical protein